MSLAKKMQQGGTTPNLYSFYGKQYDYNDLAQAADQGLNEYLATLKRGEKDSNDFRTAYSNIMSGIKDGSITFDNGQFHDSRGRYTNSDKKNKDYYGLIANYIYGKMGKSNVYQAPKDPSKIEWGDGSVKTALMRQLFNSDNGNVKDFLELDAEKNGVRSIANRSTYLSNALQSVADNWDNTFQGYQDADKSKYVPLLINAAKALRDGTIDPGDYLALSKAVGGIDFREMMATGTPTVQASTTQTVQPTQVPQTPQIKTRHASLADSSYNPETISRMTSIMTKVPTKGLINILRNSFYNRHYRFGSDPRISQIFGSSNISSKAGITATLNALNAQGVLQNADPDSPNLFYIPGTRTKKGTAWVWDKAQNTITEIPIQSIPYLNQQISINKQGGVLFAKEGDTFNNIYASAGDTGYGTYLNQIFNNDEMLNWMGSHYNGNDAIQRYSNYVKNNVDQRYTAGINDYNNDSRYSDSDAVLNFNRGYQNNGDTANYVLFGNNRDDYNNRKGGIVYNMGVTWSRPKMAKGTGDSWNEDSSKAYIDGAKGLQTYSRVASLTDSGITSGKFGKWGDAWKARGATGAYYYIADGDTSGRGQWIPTNDTTQKGYVAFDVAKPEEPQQDSAETRINPTQQPESKPNWFQQNGLKLAQDIAPLAVGAGRLFDSLHTNNKVADVIRKSINPVLKNTYELYSPVTGAFSEMQLRNRQAADVRRQASQPYTSDASLNAARQLDANRQATDLEYQGFLADDKEILRTKQEALKRQEDNIARRTDTANFNRASINQANRELAQIEANRLKSNWQSRDNFLSGIEADLKQRNAQRDYDRRVELAENKQRSLSLDMQDMNRPYEIKARNLKQQYQDSVNDMQQEFNAKLAAWQSVNGEDADYTTQPFYKDYIAKTRALRDKYYTDSDALAEEKSRGTRQYIDELRTKMNQSTLFRRGGKLSPTTMNLIRKVVK